MRKCLFFVCFYFYLLLLYLFLQPGDLTVTMHAGSKNRNFKVHVENNRQFHIGQKVFDNMDDLLEHYRTHPIYKNETEKHYLNSAFVHPGLGGAGPG